MTNSSLWITSFCIAVPISVYIVCVCVQSDCPVYQCILGRCDIVMTVVPICRDSVT